MPSLVRPMYNASSDGKYMYGVDDVSNAMGREGAIEDVGVAEEVRVPVVAKRPIAPTKAQLEEHLPLHLNYRSWCPHCVFGKAHSAHHRTAEEVESDGVTWHMDYCFFGKKSLEEEVSDSDNTFAVLVVYDDYMGAFWALRVEKKGSSMDVVKWCCDKLEDSGYAGMKIAIQCDQEPSIVELRRAISAQRLGQTVPINSPVRCSKANGKMENSVKLFQGQLRVLKHYFESKIEKHVESNRVLLSWLIPWVTESLNNFRVGSDGKACYERIAGQRCRHNVCGFGESIIWQKPPDKTNRGKLNCEFRDGIFLGVVSSS